MSRFIWRSSFVAAIALVMAMLPVRGAEARYAAIVVDGDTGVVLYERYADKRRYPASLAKMMTLYLTFEALESGKLRLDQKLKVSKRAAGQAPSRLGLKAGGTISVRDAILALVTKSANDVATVLAEAQGRTEINFARMMTAKARELNMVQTRFANASGLHNRRQVTTARDMAKLALALVEDFPRQYGLFSTKEFTYGRRTHRNHNRLIGRYAGADGIKTGYIRASGFNLVASAKRSGHRLIGVVFGGRSARTRDRHMVKLLDRGFAELKRRGSIVAVLPPLPPRKPTPLAVAEVRAAAAPDRVAFDVVEAPAEAGSAVPQDAEDGGFAIQVGAFANVASAEARVGEAVDVVPWVLEGANKLIQAIREGGRMVYRARLTGLDEAKARGSCRVLAWKKMPCVVMPSEGKGMKPVAAATN